MRLTVVGCAPAYTQRVGRASSCYMVEHDGRAILLDMGQGTFSALAGHKDVRQIDGVLVSHLHADHLVDLVPLRHFLKYEAPQVRVSLHGPTELRQRFDDFQEQTDFLDVLSGDPLVPGGFELAGLSVEARHVTHIPDSFAFRVAPRDGNGPGLVYSGDCAVADDLLPLLHDGDTLLCEAAFGTQTSGGGIHLTAREAARVAAAGRVARLVMTHILDRNDEAEMRRLAAENFGGEVLVAEPGLVLDIYG